MRLLLFIVFALAACNTPTRRAIPGPPIEYYDSTKGVIVQNSLPRGGDHTNPAGNKIGYRIFWTRVVNETATPLELTINFPADLSAIAPSPSLKLFLPSDTMALDKDSLFSYGLGDVRPFLDTGLNKPTWLRRIINPKQECLFYVGAVFDKAYAAARAGLILKDKELFYNIRGITPELDSALIPCGRIVFRK